jgi:glutaconate CoA-transferase subunit A
MTTADAIGRYVKDGDFLFIGGYIARPPFAAIHEIIRQNKRDLTITRSNAADDFDMLIGAGCVKRFISTFISLGLYGLARCYRRSIEEGIPHKIEIEEYTNLSLPLMLMAGALGMPFVPVKDMVGTDLMKVKSFMGDNKYRMIESPFDKSPVMLAPRCGPRWRSSTCSRPTRKATRRCGE